MKPMNPLVASTLITSGANIGSTIGTNIMNRSNAKSTARYQNMLNTENWRMQNAYNTPLAQMQRLKSAGLNPNLIYQAGLDNTAASVAAPQVQNPVAEAPQFDFVNDYVQMKHSANESKQVDSVVNLNSAYAKLQNTQEELMSKELGWKDRMLRQEFVNSQMQSLLFNAQANKLESETGYTRRQIDNFYRSLENQFANDRVQRAVGLQNIKHAESLIDEINQKIVESNSRIKNLQLEYLRGDIARQLEQFTFEFQTNTSIHGGKSRMEEQWQATLDEAKLRMESIEQDIFEKRFNNSREGRSIRNAGHLTKDIYNWKYRISKY